MADPSRNTAVFAAAGRTAITRFRRQARTPWFLLVATGLLFSRKPHALTTPQLWAEDGSIFLTFNDVLGLRAFLEPYMGYLHTLPRVVAWAASLMFDPRWWPACYNTAAFAGWIAVLARLFSPRLNWPGRPWLVLAVFVGPQTGEVLFNITNLQWVMALVLFQQAVIAAPTNWLQRIGDLALVVLLGLTGPFIIVLGPLFFWRWWQDRRADNLAVLVLAGACATLQAAFVVRTGPHFTFPPFDAGSFGLIVAQRLLVWPLLGEDAAHALRSGTAAWILLAGLVGFLGWTLRPHARRPLRAPAVAALLLMLGAAVYRSRPDSWDPGNLVFGDRYFFLPRVLLLWLTVWELGSLNRWVRAAAVAAFAAVTLVHLRGWQVPPPPNLNWERHVDPIRRGTPALIPILPEGHNLEYPGRPASR